MRNNFEDFVNDKINKFDLSNQEHLNQIQIRIEDFQKKQQELKVCDRLFAISFAAGIFAYTTCNILPLVTFGAFAFVNAGINYQRHNYLLPQYQETLKNAVLLYRWVMSSDSMSQKDKLGHSAIQKMIEILGIYLKKSTLVVWTEKDLEISTPLISFFKRPLELNDQMSGKLKALSTATHENTLLFQLYGEDSSGDILMAFKILMDYRMLDPKELLINQLPSIAFK